MQTIEEYYSFLEELSQQEIQIGQSLCYNLENLLKAKDKLAVEAIKFRSEFMGDYEKNIAGAYLPIGHFTNFTEEERVVCFCITLEAEYKKGIINEQKQCVLYSENQALFQKTPSLFQYVRDNELIDFSVLERINNSEIVSFSNHYGYISGYVPLNLLSWLSNQYPNTPIYIRLNPFAVFTSQPPQKIFESQLIPPNPKWWHNLTIYNRSHEGCSYFLDGSANPTQNLTEYWDYYCRNVRRLDVIAKRDGNGNLSMMLEELIEQRNIVSPTEKYIIGRMIHLDTDATIGSNFDDSMLNHIDLAINVYTDDNAKSRMDENLANGKKITDASFRTHLIRVENIRFSDIFMFAYTFFLSESLVNEWKDSQFC